MELAEFDYLLPPELIAQRPLLKRSASRLLWVDPVADRLQDRLMTELPDLVRADDLLVFNNTRVLAARLFGKKESGGRVEVMVERTVSGDTVLAMVRASKAPKVGSRIIVGGVEIQVVGRDGSLLELRFETKRGVQSFLEEQGHIPLPPYIHRSDEPQDAERYQTIFATHPGAVAAPTAGLHFDEALLKQFAACGVRHTFVTLHVGLGTFQPVRVEQIDEHKMHSERYEVTAGLCREIEKTRARGGRVIAVGTTSLRALESAAADGLLRPCSGETTLFITPGYRKKGPALG